MNANFDYTIAWTPALETAAVKAQQRRPTGPIRPSFSASELVAG